MLEKTPAKHPGVKNHSQSATRSLKEAQENGGFVT